MPGMLSASCNTQGLLRRYGIDPGVAWASLPPEMAEAGAGVGDGAGVGGAQPKAAQFLSSAATVAGASPTCWSGGHKPSAPPPPPPSSVEGLGVLGGGRGDGVNAGVGGDMGSTAAEVPVARVCGVCAKAFSSELYLSKHVHRRHPNWVQHQRRLEPAEERPSDEERRNNYEGDDVGGADKEAPAPPPLPPPKQEVVVEGGTGGEDKAAEEIADKDDEGGAEVVEGARRLGELVREREHARFRSEVVELRKEIEDLKVGAEVPRCRPPAIGHRVCASLLFIGGGMWATIDKNFSDN